MQEKCDRRILYVRKNDKRAISQRPLQIRLGANNTASNTVISSNLLLWEFCGKVFFQRITRNSTENVPFHKISTPGN